MLAQRLLQEGLGCLGLREEELEALPKGDVRKVALAGLIWRRTVVPNAWIAPRLCLGLVSRVDHGARLTMESE